MSYPVFTPDFKTDAIFRDMYQKAGGFDRVLSEAELSQLAEQYKRFLHAKYGTVADTVTERFKELRYEPEALQLTVQLELKAGERSYSFKTFQVLQNTLLIEFCIPIFNSLTQSPLQKNLLSAADMGNAYLTLNNDRQQTVVKQVPLAYFFRDTAYWQGKGKFQQSRIDWTTSLIEFPDDTIPDANPGKVIQPVIGYIDMKRYPYLESVKLK